MTSPSPYFPTRQSSLISNPTGRVLHKEGHRDCRQSPIPRAATLHTARPSIANRFKSTNPLRCSLCPSVLNKPLPLIKLLAPFQNASAPLQRSRLTPAKRNAPPSATYGKRDVCAPARFVAGPLNDVRPLRGGGVSGAKGRKLAAKSGWQNEGRMLRVYMDCGRLGVEAIKYEQRRAGVRRAG